MGLKLWFHKYLFRQYSILVPTQIRPRTQLMVVVQLLRLDTNPGMLMSSVRSLMVTVKLMRGDNSVESVTKDVGMGHTIDISIKVPYQLGIKNVLFIQPYMKGNFISPPPFRCPFQRPLQLGFIDTPNGQQTLPKSHIINPNPFSAPESCAFKY